VSKLHPWMYLVANVKAGGLARLLHVHHNAGALRSVAAMALVSSFVP
jgi:hypothetical protein